MDYPVGFYFVLSFSGETIAFKEVTGIAAELGVEEITEGGENRFKYRVPTGTKYSNLVLKRGFSPEGTKLMDWCATVIGDSLASKIQPHNITVSLVDGTGTELMTWTFLNAYPVKFNTSAFNLQENVYVIEEIEFAYNYFTASNKKVV